LNRELGLQMRGLGLLIGTSILIATATVSVSAASEQHAKIASACPTQTGKDAIGRPWTWRVVISGSVSCAEAISTNRAYIKAAREGRCPSRICTEVTFPGGWTCSSLSAAEEKQLGNGEVGGCQRKGASLTVFTVKTPGRPRLEQFLSPDRQVWCLFAFPGEVSCGTRPHLPDRSATANTKGKVTLCSVAHATPAVATCYGAWAPPGTPVLAYGHQTEGYGFRCMSASNGIICTIISGATKGKGFRVSKTEAVKVG
jgi:hypothetical protein